MSKKLLIIVICTVIIIALLKFLPFSNPLSIFQRKNDIPKIPNQSQNQNQHEIPLLSTVASNLNVPWALAFLPDGSIMFTEREGRVRLIDNNGDLQENPIAQIEAVKQIGECGLHGIAPHPNFKENSFIYIYYTFGQDGDQTQNRVSRFLFDGSSLSDEKIIVDNIPGAQFHDGGRIKFGPDNFIYITTGDALDPRLAQDKNSLAGKILRVTEEGKPAPGNPFNTLIYSYGHRNPQGITWDSERRLWESEHGSTTMDELNLIEIGANYGWPDFRGDASAEGIKPPILHSGSSTWAPSGNAYLNDSIFFVGLRGQTLYEAKISGSSVTLNKHLENQLGRMREIVVGPDNMLYISTSNRDGRGVPANDDDKIIRVNPAKL